MDEIPRIFSNAEPATSSVKEDTQAGSIIQPLVTASTSGDLDTAMQLLEAWKTTPEPRPKRGDKEPFHFLQLALEAALRNHHLDIAAYFLENGFSITQPIVRAAVRSRSTAGLELLLKHGWDINKRWYWPALPSISMTIHRNNIDLLRWFLNHGASSNVKVNPLTSNTPLSAAAACSSLTLVQELLRRGARVDNGYPLHMAAGSDESDRERVIVYLVEQGAAINEILHVRNKHRFNSRKGVGLGTPLHTAIRYGKVSVAKTLLGLGADRTIRDTRGRTPEDLARDNNDEQMLNLLWEARCRM